jgi:hypothetical protein
MCVLDFMHSAYMLDRGYPDLNMPSCCIALLTVVNRIIPYCKKAYLSPGCICERKEKDLTLLTDSGEDMTHVALIECAT